MESQNAASMLDTAVNEAHERGTGRTDKAYWAFRSFATNLADEIDDHDVDQALVEAITEDVSRSVVINFEDVPQQMRRTNMDFPEDTAQKHLKPTPELVRLALLDDREKLHERLMKEEWVSGRLTDVRVRLSSRPATTA